MSEKTIGALLSRFAPLAISASDKVISGIAYRSDRVIAGDAFFCVPGAVADGHDFAADAVRRGAVALVVERKLDLPVDQFVVSDTRAALAAASATFFDDSSAKLEVVGITGTNGKTTTAYLVDWMLSCAGRTTGLIGTVETRIAGRRKGSARTTPESYDLQKLFSEMVGAGVDSVTMEVSSHAIDLGRISGTRFAVAAFSNLTQDHLDYHHDMETYFSAKAALFTDFDVASRVICVDDIYGRRLADLCSDNGHEVLTSGFADDADIRPADTAYSATGTMFSLVTPFGTKQIAYPLIGRFNVENALLAAGCALALGVPFEVVCHALQSAPQVPGRLERVAGAAGNDRGFSVLVDYAHTPDAVEKVVAVVSAVTSGRTIVVFGCGGDRDSTKRPLMGKAALAADIAIVTSDNPRSENPSSIIDDILPGMVGGEDRTFVHVDRREAIRHAISIARLGDTVLIAGKGHEDYQLIGDKVLSFDDRVVAAEEMASLC